MKWNIEQAHEPTGRIMILPEGSDLWRMPVKPQTVCGFQQKMGTREMRNWAELKPQQ